MPVDGQSVHLGIVVVAFQQVQRGPVIGGLERAEDMGGKHCPIRRQFSEDCLANIRGHPVETGRRVLSTEILMLVVVVVGNLDLTDRLGRKIAPSL